MRQGGAGVNGGLSLSAWLYIASALGDGITPPALWPIYHHSPVAFSLRPYALASAISAIRKMAVMMTPTKTPPRAENEVKPSDEVPSLAPTLSPCL